MKCRFFAFIFYCRCAFMPIVTAKDRTREYIYSVRFTGCLCNPVPPLFIYFSCPPISKFKDKYKNGWEAERECIPPIITESCF